MDKDFACWKMAGESPGYEKRKFAFMAHPYILNPATKAQALYYDNRSAGERGGKGVSWIFFHGEGGMGELLRGGGRGFVNPGDSGLFFRNNQSIMAANICIEFQMSFNIFF